MSDIAHAVIAVGSRTKDKAVDFVAQHIPNGGWAQKCGLVSGPPEAVGSYPEVWNHKVYMHLGYLTIADDVCSLSRMWISSTLEPLTLTIMKLLWPPYKPENMFFVKRFAFISLYSRFPSPDWLSAHHFKRN